MLSVKKFEDCAKLPFKGSKHSAGYDLFSAARINVPAHGKALVALQIGISLPPGTYGRIAPRSGLAWKSHLDVGAGVIDADFRGPISVLLFNFSDQDYRVLVGDRIAQLIVEKILHPEVVEVGSLPETVRGSGGFGSTGI